MDKMKITHFVIRKHNKEIGSFVLEFHSGNSHIRSYGFQPQHWKYIQRWVETLLNTEVEVDSLGALNLIDMEKVNADNHQH